MLTQRKFNRAERDIWKCDRKTSSNSQLCIRLGWVPLVQTMEEGGFVLKQQRPRAPAGNSGWLRQTLGYCHLHPGHPEGPFHPSKPHLGRRRWHRQGFEVDNWQGTQRQISYIFRQFSLTSYMFLPSREQKKDRSLVMQSTCDLYGQNEGRSCLEKYGLKNNQGRPVFIPQNDLSHYRYIIELRMSPPFLLLPLPKSTFTCR